MATLEEGTVFGEVSFFSEAPHSASVRSRKSVEVAWMTPEDFHRLEVEHPRVACKLLRNLLRISGQRIRRMDEWVCDRIEGLDGETRTNQELRDFRLKLHPWHY